MLDTIAPDSIHILIMPGAHLLDVAAPAQVLGHASLNNKLHYISTSTEQQSTQGLTLAQLEPLPKSIPSNAWLLITGTRSAHQHLDDDAFLQARKWLGDHAAEFALWAGICSGSLLAGAAGLLDGRRCTTHHDLVDELRRRAPRADVQEDCLFIEDDNCITSAGIATGLDLSLHLVAQFWGHQAATRVARETVLYLRRAGSDSQQSFWLEHRNHVQSRVHRIQDAIMADPGADWTIASLSAIACLSERHLRRVFNEATGIRLSDYLTRARLSLATQLLRDTSLNIADVAARSGFGSERSLRRTWQQYESLSPSQFRRQLLSTPSADNSTYSRNV